MSADKKTTIADLNSPPHDDLADVLAFAPDGDAAFAADRLAARIALRRALPKSLLRRFRRGASTAIVIHAPSSAWCGPLHDAAKALLGDGLSVHFSSTTGNPTRIGGLLYFVRGGGDSKGRPDATGDALAACLTSGGSAVGIAADSSWLPAPLLAAADAFVDIVPLRGRDVARIIRLTTRCATCPTVDNRLAASLTPLQIALGVRAATTPAACLRRLRAIAARSLTTDVDIDVPPLETLAGYGEAFDFGMTLKADVQKRRRDPSAVSDDMITRSLLLSGPPGVGKSLYASALAKSCGIPLIATSYAAWQAGDAHLGIVMANMRASFAAAREAARASTVGAILFIDELDSLPCRATGSHIDLYLAALTNGLLTLAERSSAARKGGVVLLGATNFVNRIDSALLRAGRFDRVITLALPDATTFGAMLRTHLGADLADVDLVALARMAPGRTGADAAQFVRDARAAARQAGRALTVDDLVAQIMPPETRPAAQVARIARHEAAHAVVGLRLGVQHLESVTLSAPGADGIARFSRYADTSMTRASINSMVITALSGRAADADEAFGQPDAGSGGGPGSDLGNATHLLALAHASFGLGGTLVSIDPEQALARLHADAALAARIEVDLQRLYRRAQAMVAKNRTAIEMVAAALVKRRFLTGDEVRALLKRVRAADPTRLVQGRAP